MVIMHNNHHINNLKENGYTVLKNVYSEEEITFLRNSFIEYFNEGGGFIVDTIKTRMKRIRKNIYQKLRGEDFISKVAKVKVDWFKESKLSIYRDLTLKKLNAEILSTILNEKIIFAERNDFHINTNADWHKDVLNRGAKNFQKNSPWEPEGINQMKIYTAITYLQKIPKDEGFMIKKGSHLKSDYTSGENYIISDEVKLGDVILFDIRLTHRPVYSEKYNRLFFSTSYGVENKYLHQYIKGTLYRQRIQNAQNKLHY